MSSMGDARRLLRSLPLVGCVALFACAAKDGGPPVTDGDGGSGGGTGGVTVMAGKGGSGNGGNGGNAGAGGGSGDAATTRPDGGSAGDGPVDLPPPGGPFPALADATTVVISELMYHPVQENADDENHEFIEIFNRSKATVSLAGWTLATTGTNPVAFTFPAGAQIMAGQYRVVAKNRKQLVAVNKYGLTDADLFGDYTGELDNGGTTLTLKDAAGAAMDSLKYNDKVPWPISPDGLGVSEEFLPKEQQPVLKHQYMGRSLERIDIDLITNDAANWDASALDGATPGKANSVAGTVTPVVTTQQATPVGGTGFIIRAKDSVSIQAKFSMYGALDTVQLESFIDDISKVGEATMTTAMTFNAVDRSYSAVLGPQPDNTVVRYRFVVSRNGKPVVASPRPTDPYGWNAYFVTPDVKSDTRTFHLFLTAANWTLLEKWLMPGRATGTAGCTPNKDWQSEVPATFVSEGHVYDAFVRYEGSRYQRHNGATIAKWTVPGPTSFHEGTQLKALSWRIKVPKYDPIDGVDQLALNKMYQGCPGTVTHLESRLLENAKFPSYHSYYARLHINGAYYHYMNVPEDIDDKMMKRYVANGEKVGEIYKDDGASGDEGAIARGDFSPITVTSCGGMYSILTRYDQTYSRSNYTYRHNQEIMKLITDLNAVRKDVAALRTYFTTYWDVDAMLTMLAIRNWAGVWDDTFHNLFPYKRADGKWLGLQQDFEWDFGLGQFGGETNLSPWRPKETFYIGLDPALSEAKITQQCELDPVADKDWIPNCNFLGFSRLKDGLIRAFKTEFDQKLKDLSKTVLSPAQVNPIIDEEVAAFNITDWNADPTDKTFCNVKQRHDYLKTWVTTRNDTLISRLKP